jgi:uncharacterized protein (TIGR00251 family)
MSPSASDGILLSLPFSATRSGVRVRVRVAPRAAGNRIDGIVGDGEGGAILKVAVTAPPEGGKANAALIKLLAREWRLPKSSLAVTAGASERRKTVSIEGDAWELTKGLTAWAAKWGSID